MNHPYIVRSTDPQLLSVDYRIFRQRGGKELRVPAAGKLVVTLNWIDYLAKGLWCSRRCEDVEWKGDIGAKGVLFFRVSINNIASLPVPLRLPPELLKRLRRTP